MKKNIYDFIDTLKTPCHVLDMEQLFQNIHRLDKLRSATDLKLLFAIKGFSNESVLGKIAPLVDGFSTSSRWEMRLASEMPCKEIHIYSPAYTEADLKEISMFADCIVFNSTTQLLRAHSLDIHPRHCGLRVNPEYSEIQKENINPCQPFSRFGVHYSDLENLDFSLIDGLHFHTMSGQLHDTLMRTLQIVEAQYGKYLANVSWLNLGGGQAFCDDEFNMAFTIELLLSIKKRYKLQLIVEPCETILSNVGYFVSTVTDIVHNQMDIAILDSSMICHLSDIKNSPYRCDVLGADELEKKAHNYRLTGATCYAGDIFGDYSFAQPLHIGDRIVFCDTAAYSVVKSNVFNGISLPNIYIVQNDDVFLDRVYCYNTFKALL